MQPSHPMQELCRSVGVADVEALVTKWNSSCTSTCCGGECAYSSAPYGAIYVYNSVMDGVWHCGMTNEEPTHYPLEVLLNFVADQPILQDALRTPKGNGLLINLPHLLEHRDPARVAMARVLQACLLPRDRVSVSSWAERQRSAAEVRDDMLRALLVGGV